MLSARLLGLDLKHYPGKKQHMLNKDLTRFMQSLARARQNRSSERKALLAKCKVEEALRNCVAHETMQKIKCMFSTSFTVRISELGYHVM